MKQNKTKIKTFYFFIFKKSELIGLWVNSIMLSPSFKTYKSLFKLRIKSRNLKIRSKELRSSETKRLIPTFSTEIKRVLFIENRLGDKAFNLMNGLELVGIDGKSIMSKRIEIKSQSIYLVWFIDGGETINSIRVWGQSDYLNRVWEDLSNLRSHQKVSFSVCFIFLKQVICKERVPIRVILGELKQSETISRSLLNRFLAVSNRWA